MTAFELHRIDAERNMRRFYAKIALICTIVSSLAIPIGISKSIADEKITQLKTSAGLLEARVATGRDCKLAKLKTEICTAFYLNNILIYAEHILRIVNSFPSEDVAQLVYIHAATEAYAGSKNRHEYDYILDLTKTPPLELTGLNFHKISRSKFGVVFEMRGLKDNLGDESLWTYNYQLGSGNPVKMREETIYRYEPLTDDSTSDDLLSDAEIRKPIILVVGTDDIYQFRKTMQPGDELRRIGYNVIVGSGCEPESENHCALFVVDTKNNLAWAVESDGTNGIFEPKTAKLWGLLTPNDVEPLHEIRNWLYKQQIARRNVFSVPLPDSVVQLYKRPRKAVAKAEQPGPLPQSATHVANENPTLSQAPNGAQVVIRLQREGGTFVVPISINGALTLKFTIDSGAADVSIPADVVMTLLRTGTLSDEDFLGTQTYRLADGSTVPSQTFRIRSLKVGNRVIEDVTGSVASAKGTPLLGQSFFSRFKAWKIDNERQILLLE